MTLRVISEPPYEPVSLAEARSWLRLESDDSANTAVLTLLIQAMREYAENLTGRAFVQRTLELTLPCFPEGGVIELPRPPLASVEWVKYYDYTGTLQTVAAADYEVDTYRAPGRIKPAYLESWPGTRNVFNAVQVRYVAGYPVGSPQDEAGCQENIPATLKLWMQTRLATLFEHREQLVVGAAVAQLPRDFTDGLLDGLRVANWWA